jgi:molecular chaperone DnaJ
MLKSAEGFHLTLIRAVHKVSGVLISIFENSFSNPVIVGRFAVPNILGRWLFRGPRLARPGSDLLTDLEIELIEAALGTTRHIEVNRHEFCAECGGSGWRKGTFPPSCNDCGGRGQVVTVRCFLPVVSICPTCAGHGPPVTDPCPNCQGSKRTSHVVGLAVDVPPGVESGMWLQIRNEGELGDRGAPRGNWRIHLLVKKHPIFDRRHNDLYCQLAVTDAAMAVGAEVQVPTLDGTCPLRIPRGTLHGDLLRVRGRGMPDISGRGRGDIVVEVVRETPEL